MFYPMYFDPTYMLVIIGVIICMLASAKMNSTFNKYSRVRNHSGMTGREAAEQILHRAGIYDVRVERVSGNLTDHYSPKDNVINLSDSVYGSTSVAAIGVACHEAGHAIQHAVGYQPIKIRNAIVPITNIGSSLAIPLILLGFLFPANGVPVLSYVGLGCFFFAVIFQLVTLPTEFDASNRALKALSSGGYLTSEELKGSKQVLMAAALTYVAALATALAQFLRLLVIVNSRNNKR